ncbi:MOB kinase activator 2 isoform X2 [Hypomesus transpacificus]|uniref:MOB kinase activator 2 isoform X2 n=1 Tax=Hypomesus transpacificus TaxID=137520 RepID=UPI001F07F4CD|nr:MOB kinase activator 2 isoform X2 [Hypomesus transpacificus]
MGGCHSYPSAAETDTTTLHLSDIADDKLGINNNNLEERPYLQPENVRERITDTNMSSFTTLPPGLDHTEWLATNTVAFFQNTNLLSSALSEFCTTASCPTACGPGNTVYFWTDDQGKKLKCSAPLYFDYAMSYIQELLADEDVFPTKAGSVFPAGFVFLVQKVFLLLFRTLAHIYWSHYRETLALGLHPHLNTLFTHLTHFSLQHRLLEPEHTDTLRDLISALGQNRLSFLRIPRLLETSPHLIMPTPSDLSVTNNNIALRDRRAWKALLHKGPTPGWPSPVPDQNHLTTGEGLRRPRALRGRRHTNGGGGRGHAQLMRVGCVLGTCQVQNLSHRLYQLIGQSGREDSSPINPRSPHSYG